MNSRSDSYIVGHFNPLKAFIMQLLLLGMPVHRYYMQMNDGSRHT